ncbi:MAG: DUF3310 domain-containing protein [Bifidobacterium scardovii]|jgi:hypothetical protein|uniref:DUF3310 domain-containing protein n=1 Tax=Bifidobacterium scardovii TaxID=158787 RepID=UPI00204780DB|nr:DUF3310 domain-containing protein [Bifidobacterium scardovii]MDU2421277.1 DUF3310 domain-containing protein [Bifidobacterium scardovii]DAZ29432.1 MAG TPA: nucelotide kinase [Caudoviricetes sp.]
MSWINDPVNSPKHYTDSHPGMECIELTADTSFCLGNCCKYLWRYHSKGRPLEDLEKAHWYLARLIERGEHIRLTQDQRIILNALGEQAANHIEANLWLSIKTSRPDTALRNLDKLIEMERNRDETSHI